MSLPASAHATYACAGALIDELARGGVRHLCLCPGSRSTPLALSAARHSGLRVWTFIDERSSAFFALGMAKALRAPVAVLATSGTAAANFLPAVVEAHYGRVPLVVLTADRPRTLRDAAAAQTIDQVRLYGSHAKWFVDVAEPRAAGDRLRYVRATASRAAALAGDRPAGPVHLNVPFDEPLVPPRGAASSPTPDDAGRRGGRPFAALSPAQRTLAPAHVRALAADLRRARGVIVCGPSDVPALGSATARLAAALGYPILADPLSQVRCGPHDRGRVIDAYDALLRVPDVAAWLAPEIILRLGGVSASKPLLQYIERHASARLIVVDGGDGGGDPTRLASDIVDADPRWLCDALAGGGPAAGRGRSAWLRAWQRANAVAGTAIRRHLAGVAEPFEGKVFAELGALLPAGATLYAGNSMPVRDLETFLPATARPIRMLGNRGASGIDGVISSALGAAASDTGPVVLVVGDLSFYHDLNGLLAAKRHGLRATIVLLNNDGGGIFSFLPQAEYPEHFEALWGTPTGLDFAVAARLYGAAFARPRTWPAFRRSVRAALRTRGVSVVEVRTRRDRNVVMHREVWAAVERALRRAGLPEARQAWR